ncbi:hypothetical protein MUG78_10480 [Gordonia alkaliphila]|uniref:hypothetical protein n=1 Tax=Gordonia alkaliphila TaxID=1053547 RepID=UPI001FF19111|nr:hypothetical protein [Gordonia alkaliphila]MCK0439871.1 hypothetical protein [Gordonia alkaliphila]
MGLFGIDRDLSRVAAYALPDTAVVRVFSLIRLQDPEGTIRWAESDPSVLSALTTFREASAGTPVRRRPAQPMGMVDAETVTSLQTLFASDEELNVLVWSGYADSAQLADRDRPATGDAAAFIEQGGLLQLRIPARELADFTEENGRHFPVAVWNDDESIAIAQPVYHDSVYVSAVDGTVVEALLRAPTIEGRPISPVADLPSYPVNLSEVE